MAYVGKSPKGGYSPCVYKKPLTAADVEISADMYIITAEEAEKHIKPPELTHVRVSPSSVMLRPDTSQTFRAAGVDQFGREIEVGAVEWSATGGQIDPDGVFVAGGSEGNFIVTATAGRITGAADVQIQKKGTVEPPDPDPPKEKRTLTWSGEIAPQKWMNFYTKVLTAFVKGGSLKVTVTMEASPDGGVSDQQVESTKASLRGLGLNDSVDTR